MTSLADAPDGSYPSIVISCLADWAKGKVKFDHSMQDYKWTDLKEAKKIGLIEGIYEELLMAEYARKGGKIGEWKNPKKKSSKKGKS